jgi:hypothetical protein
MPAGTTQATGLSAAEVVRLLHRKRWHAEDLAALQAVADRLGLEAPLKGLDPSAGKGRAAWRHFNPVSAG